MNLILYALILPAKKLKLFLAIELPESLVLGSASQCLIGLIIPFVKQ